MSMLGVSSSSLDLPFSYETAGNFHQFLPLELTVYTCSFLRCSDLANVAVLNHYWRHIVYSVIYDHVAPRFGYVKEKHGDVPHHYLKNLFHSVSEVFNKIAHEKRLETHEAKRMRAEKIYPEKILENVRRGNLTSDDVLTVLENKIFNLPPS